MRGGAPKRLSACPPLEIIDRAMPLIFVGPRHVKYGLLSKAQAVMQQFSIMCQRCANTFSFYYFKMAEETRRRVIETDDEDAKLVFETSEEVQVTRTFDQMKLREDLIRGIYAYGE